MAGLLSGKLKSLRSQAGAKAWCPEPGATIEPPTVRVRDECTLKPGRGWLNPGPSWNGSDDSFNFDMRRSNARSGRIDLADGVDGYPLRRA